MRDNPAVNAMVTSLTTLGRTGVPSDIGPLIAALLSDENRWINARRIDVSGACVYRRGLWSCFLPMNRATLHGITPPFGGVQRRSAYADHAHHRRE